MDPIAEVEKIHRRIWKQKRPVSEATKAAIQITRAWQEKVVGSNSLFISEYPVEGLGEKIDLLDTSNRIAYELKVSPNNTHMEFYRDVFKVLAHNESAKKSEAIKKLVFVTPEAGASRLQRGLGQAACRISKKFGFIVEIVAI